MITTILSVASAIMAALSLVLHAIAPHTKTTLDDRAAVIVYDVIAKVKAAEGK